MQYNFKIILFSVILFLSNVTISQTNLFDNSYLVSCKPPSNIKIIETTTSSAKITWKSKANGIAWRLKWRKRDETYTESNTSELITQKEYTIFNLESDSKYFFKLQTLCNDDTESKWSSSEYSFITNFNNPSKCNLDLKLKEPYLINDSLYSGKTYFYIQNDEFSQGKLGVDVFLKSVNLIVEHSWTHDLEIKLWSPSNKSVVLASDHGISSENKGYGNTEDTVCAEPIVFSDDACFGLTNETQYIGDFKPDNNISMLYDSTSPAGVWKLEIIDKSLSNSGNLQYIELDLEPIICPVPKNISIIPQDENSVLINWDKDSKSDSILIHIFSNNTEIILTDENIGNILIDNVSDLNDIALQAKCFNHISLISCSYSTSILCGSPQSREDFDLFNVCKTSCEDCIISGIWHNAAEGRNWLINQGATTTENTGPPSDVYGQGKYAYFESSSNNCSTEKKAILQSECIFVEHASDGCSMQFYYYMHGVDIGALSFEVSIDNENTWQQLFYVEGLDSSKWIKQTIDLALYENRTCNFRFVAESLNNGNFGDIAIDDIIFYNSSPQTYESNLYYPDRDNDGFGKDTIGTFFCNLSNNLFVNNNDDCDDTNSGINPDAEEIPCNFIDENCNGMADDQTQGLFDINIVNNINESCDGSIDGSITLSVSGGFPPYNFLWSNSSTDSILLNVNSGKYWCEITDQTGCGMITDTFEIIHLNPFSISVDELTQPSCNGIENGSISVNINGGIEPYNFIWNTGDTTTNLQNLQAGIYNVSVTDSSGCRVISDDIKLTATTIFDIDIINMVEPSCFEGNNGSIFIRVNNGIAPYTFEWNNGSTSNNISGLETGEYYCTITDNALCFQKFGPIIIGQPDSLDIFISAIDHVTCIGQNNGSIETGTKGGTIPYTFEWFKNNKIISRNDDIYNISSGIYKLNVRDINGCSKTLERIEINTIDSITVDIDSIIDVSCSNTKNGSISINASKGYGNYYYYWSNGIKANDSINNLDQGEYSVTVVDDLGCKQVLSNIEIANLNIPINLEMKIIDSIKCFNDNSGKISVEVFSDNSPYDYNWSAGIKTIKNNKIDTLDNLTIGSFNVTVTDNDGCVGTSEYAELIQPDKLEIKRIYIENILCNGDNSGEISLSVEGGTLPYQFVWADSLSGNYITKLKADEYKVTITDNNNCVVESKIIQLSEPEELSVTIESNPAHKNESDGSARILPSGGVSPYYFSWDEKANNQTGNTATDLSSGWYNVTMEDYNECTKEIKVFIGELPPNSTNENEINPFILQPNPVDNYLYIYNNKNRLNLSELKIINLNGIEKNISFHSIDINKVVADVSSLPNGCYFLVISNDQKHSIKRFVVIH